MARLLMLLVATVLMSNTHGSVYSPADAVISLDEHGFDALMADDGVAVVRALQQS